MVTTFLGWGAGMGLLLLGPGTRSRVDMLPEGNYTGIAGILASAYKITLSMKELFTPLIIILVIAIVILSVQGYYKNLNSIILDDGIIYLITGIAVCYVLAIMEPPANRAYFGGSVFLIIASINMIQSIRVNDSTHEIYRVLKYSLAALLVIATIYDASIGVINLHRLNREESERIELIQTQIADGVNEIIVPQYTRDFDTRYSTAIASDMTEEPMYWINYFYSVYYRCQGIVAIPRDEYEQMYGE